MSELIVTPHTPALGTGLGVRTYGVVRALAAHGPVTLVYARFGPDAPDSAFASIPGLELVEVVPSRGAARALAYARARIGLVSDHFARGIELRLKQIAERETAPPQRCSGGIAAAARSDLIAHALAGAFVGFLNAWTRKGQPHSAAAMDTLFHELAWAGIRNLQGRKSENQGQVLKHSTFR